MTQKIITHRDLEVYKRSFDSAMEIFELSKRFPKEEVYSLTDQIRRSSRSVCANLGEAWRKRRYEGAFKSKLNDVEAEAAETQTWLEFAVACGYLDGRTGGRLQTTYDGILATLVGMINHSDTWVISGKPRYDCTLSPCHLVPLSPCHSFTSI